MPSFLTRAAALSLLLSSGACYVQLKNQEAPPAYPVEGLWIEKDIGSQISMIHIEKNPVSGGDAAPYLYTYLVVVGRNLLISDRTLVITRRKGEARTSQGELLLVQRSFSNGARRITQKPLDPDIWQAADFSSEAQDVQTQRTYNYSVLDLIDENTLSGSEGVFHRVTPASTSRFPSVAVWRTSKDGLQAAGFLFPALQVGAGTRLKTPGGETEATISGVAGEYVTLAIGRGALKPGAGMVSVDAKVESTRPLSKEEVLEKLRKGEPVPREDLIRALGDKKQ